MDCEAWGSGYPLMKRMHWDEVGGAWLGRERRSKPGALGSSQILCLKSLEVLYR